MNLNQFVINEYQKTIQSVNGLDKVFKAKFIPPQAETKQKSALLKWLKKGK